MEYPDYLTAGAAGTGEYDEKKSRFLGAAYHAATAEEALARVGEIKGVNRDARHNCYAYLLRNGEKRYSDDGEPQGTAGRPMLELLERRGILDCVVVVTRYFGGILLGTGGLVRAYSAAAEAALAAAGTVEMTAFSRFSLSCSYEKYSRVQAVLAACGGKPEQSDFGERVRLTVLIPVAAAADFPARLIDATLGECVAEQRETIYQKR